MEQSRGVGALRVRFAKRLTRVQVDGTEGQTMELCHITRDGHVVVSIGRPGQVPGVIVFNSIGELREVVDRLEVESSLCTRQPGTSICADPHCVTHGYDPHPVM